MVVDEEDDDGGCLLGWLLVFDSPGLDVSACCLVNGSVVP